MVHRRGIGRALAAWAWGAGCATVMNGTHQDLRLSVQPENTQVSVFRMTGEVVAGPASSPGTVDVHRPESGQSYFVVATHAGYCPRYWVTRYGVQDSGGYVDDVLIIFTLFPGLVMASVDSLNGAGFTIEPPAVEGSLLAESQCP